MLFIWQKAIKSIICSIFTKIFLKWQHLEGKNNKLQYNWTLLTMLTQYRIQFRPKLTKLWHLRVASPDKISMFFDFFQKKK